MFDLEDALSDLNGRSFSFDELRSEMARIRLEHLDQLPPELNVNELIRIARQRAWIQEEPSGDMIVEVHQPVGV